MIHLPPRSRVPQALAAFALAFLPFASHGDARNAEVPATMSPLPRECLTLGLKACPVPFDEVVPSPREMLTWSQDDRVVGFRNTWRQYPGDVFHADPAHLQPLPRFDVPLSPRYQVKGQSFGIEDYLREQAVTGLLVIYQGHIVYEHYARGNTEKTLWTSRSVAKSVVSILIGVAVREGRIKSVDDPITAYLPELRQTAWEGVTLRNLLQHTSGVDWNEDYTDPRSDFAQLTRCEAGVDSYACILRLIRGVGRKPGVKPGEVWSYNTGGAWLAGRVLERATGMPIARYLETRLWRRFGMESDGVWQALVPGQIDMGGHGFNATLRDWGRFGLFVAREGVLSDGTKLLPPDWLAQSRRWTTAAGSIDATNPEGQYGYQWWHLGAPPGSDAQLAITAERTMWAEGIYGQVIAVDPVDALVMVQWSTYPIADASDSLEPQQLLFFNALRESLAPVRIH
jgi:CubicO group peptidase (beta-lactamase class C family)